MTKKPINQHVRVARNVKSTFKINQTKICIKKMMTKMMRTNLMTVYAKMIFQLKKIRDK